MRRRHSFRLLSRGYKPLIRWAVRSWSWAKSTHQVVKELCNFTLQNVCSTYLNLFLAKKLSREFKKKWLMTLPKCVRWSKEIKFLNAWYPSALSRSSNWNKKSLLQIASYTSYSSKKLWNLLFIWLSQSHTLSKSSIAWKLNTILLLILVHWWSSRSTSNRSCDWEVKKILILSIRGLWWFHWQLSCVSSIFYLTLERFWRISFRQ